jgi:Aldose 1-epimerase
MNYIPLVCRAVAALEILQYCPTHAHGLYCFCAEFLQFFHFLLFQHVWNASVEEDCVVMNRISPDGEEHYPGTVHVNVSYCLTDNNELFITHRAHLSGQPSPVSLSNEIFFNLASEVMDLRMVFALSILS